MGKARPSGDNSRPVYTAIKVAPGSQVRWGRIESLQTRRVLLPWIKLSRSAPTIRQLQRYAFAFPSFFGDLLDGTVGTKLSENGAQAQTITFRMLTQASHANGNLHFNYRGALTPSP